MALLRGAQRDYQELGYGLADVHHCIADLTLGDFHHSVDIEGVQYDVYYPRYRGPNGPKDELYVKLAERSGTTVPQVVVASFHLQRKN